mmetsp:Transcript_12968/g.24370  ORF Transcript_12968/g.24370 Transcript_12968/m.24370 type:complete len:104 (+) Transcript_12968:238-549(+)|eukprot:CAMPEP_0176496004 /NCGR_PEP_ID=MMETSP0200_2-20121128/10967_1 /TAXON_ID=947934 /ORGANISM="Chaetoceros sp., Strain GSL56" /LENGTH=103 /DNA_ID=CAMNT_0017893937 /DNA_START=198 /DNA_END=509 /DNA_ORIENTATION=-
MSNEPSNEPPSGNNNNGNGKNKVLGALSGAVKAVGDKAKELDSKLHVTEKTKQATEAVIQKGKEIDGKLHISEKTKKAADGIGDAVKKGSDFVAEKLKPKDQK